MRWILSVISLCKCKFDIMSQYVYALFFGNAVDKQLQLHFARTLWCHKKRSRTSLASILDMFLINQPGDTGVLCTRLPWLLHFGFWDVDFCSALSKVCPLMGWLRIYLLLSLQSRFVGKNGCFNRHSHWNSTWTSRTVTDCYSFLEVHVGNVEGTYST